MTIITTDDCSAGYLTQWERATKVLTAPRGVFPSVYIYGPPGVGKTYVAMRQGLEGRGVYCLTLTPETPASEGRGFFMPRAGSFEWVDGPLIRAMREGARVVLNEVSHASHDVLAFLYPLLESVATAALTLPTSETVRPAAGFQLVLTDNFPPHQLPEALQNRFASIIEITELHPDGLALLAPFYRAAAKNGTALQGANRISLRGWLTCQEAERHFGRELAMQLVFGVERGSQVYAATKIASA